MAWLQRKAMLSSTPSLEIKNDGETWSITLTDRKTDTQTFKLGEKFDHTALSGDKQQVEYLFI